MTVTVILMIIIGIVFVIASFFVTESISKKEDSYNLDLMTVDEDYQFSERELQIIKRKIEDVIANQAKDILYETNESLSNMANEKTMALGDYAVAVCDEIEKNHKEVMFLYSMLDDKQKEIMKTVKDVDSFKSEINNAIRENSEQQIKFMEAFDQAVSNNLNSADEKGTDVKQSVQDVTDNNVTSSESDLYYSENDSDDIFAEIDQADSYFDEVLEKDFKDDANANDIILEMYNNGSSIIEIAKELGLGVGEVKLVIDLYQGE